MLPPLSNVAYATRHAYSAAAALPADTPNRHDLRVLADVAMSSSSDEAKMPSFAPPPVLPFVTQMIESGLGAGTAHTAGLAMLSDESIWIALRTAMHIQGNRETRPPPAVRAWLADRYLEQRVAVDQHTAYAVLLEAFLNSHPVLLRHFPGAIPPVRATVTEALTHPPSVDERVYNYNHHGSEVHYILRSPITDTASARAARGWWASVSDLADTGPAADLSSGVVWSFISRRANTLLHLDTIDGTTTQWLGKKLWVVIDKEEAAQMGIGPIHADVMRDRPVGSTRFTDWQACPSFRWCILQEGDTLVLPYSLLHAVSCIGDVDAVSTGSYCWLRGTPMPKELAKQVKPTRDHKRRRSPSLCPSSPPAGVLQLVVRAMADASPRHLPAVVRTAAATLIVTGVRKQEHQEQHRIR